MKSKIKNRVLAGFMALLMVVGLVPTSFAGGNVEVKAAGTTYTFDATALTAAADKEELTGKVANDYATVFGTVQKRTNSDGSVGSVEIGKNASSGFEFTAVGNATVKVTISSTGGSNTSVFSIVDSTGTAQEDSTGTSLLEVTGSSSAKQTFTYELTAGTYKMISPEWTDSAGKSRGARVYYFEITDVPASVTTEYTFDATALTAAADKEELTGKVANDFATVFGTVQKRTNSDGSVGSVEIGKNASSGFEFTITGTATVSVTISSTGGSNTSVFSIVDSTGTAQEDSTGTSLLEVTGSSSAKQTFTYELTAGTYKMISPEWTDSAGKSRGARVYNFTITETTGGSRPARKDWASVATPSVSATVDGTDVKVEVTASVGYDGADKVVVSLLEGTTVIDSETYMETSESKNITFTPSKSGTYTVQAVASRKDETDKTSNAATVNFVLPLETPVIASATSTGAGTVNVVWGAVAEAETYEVYCSGTLVGTTDKTSYAVSGLTVGTKYSFTVVAVRGAEKSSTSNAVEATATETAQTVWAFTRYGSSTNEANNGYVGGVNETGSVTVYSENGKGKIVPNSTDGLAFYYTTVPSNMNFTLRANVHVDNWTLSNGQEGFGIMAADRVGDNGDTNPVWNNSVMAIAGTKVEYFWDSEKKEVSTAGTKYTMKTSVGTLTKWGVTQDNLPLLNANDTATVNNEFKTETVPLELSAAKQSLEAGTYNIVGNATKELDGTIANITDFVLEVQKNNTGYFVTYYDSEGNIIGQHKGYDTGLLSKVDKDNVYVGFFASRNARATFSNISFTTISPELDAPAEEKPIERIVPTVTIQSADVSNTEEYTLQLISNVDGVARITINGETFMEGVVLEGEVRKDIDLILPDDNKNYFVVYFTPDPNQEMEEDTVLDNTDEIKVKLAVDRNVYYEELNTLYVAPWGHKSNRGTRNNPLDIYRAIDIVRPGQTIVLMEGTYLLEKTVRIERGIDGTAEQPINMVADPEATSRPILDFQWNCAGMIIGGDYWYLSGFDVTHSINGQKGIQVSGSNNILDQVDAYHNGNTGIQISRLFSTDTWEDWPANNLILNCTSYGNADAGYEDADGFAAKLTIGDGNVFDGCVAFNNADDGWDLFAKVETGSIGSVTIQNCVAYQNGYLEDGTNAGNGNGFKMGGESLSGKHQLINSYAFFNKAKGIDSNSCPDIIVKNSTSYNNESYNVALYTNNAANTDFKASGVVSFKDESIKKGYDVVEQFKVKGSQSEADYLGTSNYYWNGSQTLNTAGAEITADDFVTLIFRGVARNADGTINMLGFLQLKDTTIGGAQETGTPSMSVTILPNPVKPSTGAGADDGSSEGGSGVSVATGDTTPIMFLVVVMVASALACVVTFRRKRA